MYIYHSCQTGLSSAFRLQTESERGNKGRGRKWDGNTVYVCVCVCKKDSSLIYFRCMRDFTEWLLRKPRCWEIFSACFRLWILSTNFHSLRFSVITAIWPTRLDQLQHKECHLFQRVDLSWSTYRVSGLVCSQCTVNNYSRKNWCSHIITSGDWNLPTLSLCRTHSHTRTLTHTLHWCLS